MPLVEMCVCDGCKHSAAAHTGFPPFEPAVYTRNPSILILNIKRSDNSDRVVISRGEGTPAIITKPDEITLFSFQNLACSLFDCVPNRSGQTDPQL